MAINRRNFLKGLAASVAGLGIFRKLAEDRETRALKNVLVETEALPPRSSLFNIDPQTYEKWRSTPYNSGKVLTYTKDGLRWVDPGPVRILKWEHGFKGET